MEGFKKEELECPICSNIPLNEIFQCKNGHIACDGCISKLSTCPQCRAPLTLSNRSRNRFMESMLDRMQLDCPYVEHGCKEKFKRSLIQGHKSSCKYAQSLNLCKLLGNSSCDFKLHFGNWKETVEHLKFYHATAHTAFPPKPGSVSIVLEGFGKIANRGETVGCANAHTAWNLIIQDDSSPSPSKKKTYVVLCKLEDNFLSLACLNLDMDLALSSGRSSNSTMANTLDVTLTIPTKNDSMKVKFYLPIVYGLDSNSSRFLEHPPFKISTPYLMQHSDGAQKKGMGLRMDIHIHKEDAVSSAAPTSPQGLFGVVEVHPNRPPPATPVAPPPHPSFTYTSLPQTRSIHNWLAGYDSAAESE